MSTPRDLVQVKIGGLVHANWSEYDIDSDLLTPADAWRVTLNQDEISLPAAVTEGAEVEVSMKRDGEAETVLTGRLDSRRHTVERNSHHLQLAGRDGAAVLLDCSVPITSMRSVTLDQVITTIAKPLGVRRYRIDADKTRLTEKSNTEPGDTAWDALRRAAEANGLWPWFEPDGTLVVGGPDYSAPPVASLFMARDGKGNNLLSLTEERNLAARFSQVTVLGQSWATGTGGGERDGRAHIKAVVVDEGVKVYRPKVLVDHEAVSEEIARSRGRKFISDSRLHGYTITARVGGHRTAGGVLWKPGQRVTLKSEPHGLDGVYFLMGRRFLSNRRDGQVTDLTLKEDGVWTLDAHPSKRKHRRGKNSLPGRVVDLGGPT